MDLILLIQLFLNFLVHATIDLANTDGPQLQLDIGRFEGKLFDFGNNGQVEAFYGLPFADKVKRFEKPKDPLPNLDKTTKAVEKKLACPQISHNKAFEKFTSEDCLYLNLFRPVVKNNSKLPLVLFVHGGGYQAGTDLIHSLDYVAEHYAAKGLIYVTVHYRMGITGLGSGNHSDFNGNLALWDVRQALLWLRSNSEAIGIDLNRITLWGYSAGASVVGHLVLSRQTRDLFTQVIQMSGSSINEWSYSNISIVSTQLVAQHLQCNKFDALSIKECLTEKTIEELHSAVRQIPNKGSFLNTNKFTPTPDGEFFDSDLTDLLETAPPKPTLSSLTQNEALLFVIYEIFDTNFHVAPEERPNFTKEKLKQILCEQIITEKAFGNQATEVIEEILEFYLPENEDQSSNDYKEIIVQYSQLISDILVVVPQMLEMRRKVEIDWPVYHLLTTHNENIRRNYPKAISFETTHGFEYSYLFGYPFVGDVNLTETDLVFRDNLVDAVVNFIKFGSPNSPNHSNFQIATKQDPFLYTDVSLNFETKNRLFQRNVEFWENLTQKYGYDVMRGQSVRQIKHQEL